MQGYVSLGALIEKEGADTLILAPAPSHIPPHSLSCQLFLTLPDIFTPSLTPIPIVGHRL